MLVATPRHGGNRARIGSRLLGPLEAAGRPTIYGDTLSRNNRREVHPVYKTKWTAEERDFWEVWLVPKLGCDEDGYWFGHCPMHDAGRQDRGSAGFNFTNGSWRCNRIGPDNCLHPKKGGSVANLEKYINQNLLDDE